MHGQTRCGQSLQEEWSVTLGVDYYLSELLHQSVVSIIIIFLHGTLLHASQIKMQI